MCLSVGKLELKQAKAQSLTFICCAVYDFFPAQDAWQAKHENPVRAGCVVCIAAKLVYSPLRRDVRISK